MAKKKNKDVRFYERRFLNRKHGRAYTIAKVDKSTGPRKDKYSAGNKYWSDSVSAYLEIGDCNDNACLEFSFSFANKKQTEKQLAKMDDFIKTCQQMRAAMAKDNDKLRAEYKKFQKKQKKAQKKRNK